jgi:hypothetical protein
MALVRTDVTEEPIASIIRVTRIRSVLLLLVTINVVPNSPILITLMMEAMRSSETSDLTRITLRHFPEDNILHSYCRENLRS